MKNLLMRHLILLSIFLLSFTITFSQSKKGVKEHTSLNNTQNTITKNGIKFISKGFKVSEAYLVFEDENLVPEGNKISLNQTVNILLIIDGGWKEAAGRVFPGGTQQILTVKGKVIESSEDAFSTFDTEGLTPEDARYIMLNTKITDVKNRKNFVIVNFKVWDKKSDAEINGSYKLYIK